MKRFLFILLNIPIIIFGQNSSIRLFPIYPMFTPIITQKGLELNSMAAIGSTLGYDQKISDFESIEINFKPRIHIFDGEQEASDFRMNFNYKKFTKYNFYISSGLAFNFLKDFSSWSPYYGGGDCSTILTIGPNLSFGRRTIFRKRFFLDFGLGFRFNYLFYNQIRKKRPIELESNNIQFTTFTDSGPKYYFLDHVLTFQFGYILR
tara:strand:+ start:506 stop:1123 length:618 start_codon:yes stop_codon:yes gene_type:complete